MESIPEIQPPTVLLLHQQEKHEFSSSSAKGWSYIYGFMVSVNVSLSCFVSESVISGLKKNIKKGSAHLF